MSCFSNVFNENPEYAGILAGFNRHRLPMGVLGLSPIHKAHLIAALTEDLGRKALVVTPDEAQATRLARDMNEMGRNAVMYPAGDFSFRSSEGRSRDYEHIRIRVLCGLLEGDYDVVTCSAEDAMQLTVPPKILAARSSVIRKGDRVKLEGLADFLHLAGYTRSEMVEGLGQYSVRGGIVDFFPTSAAQPCRAEFWGDSVESLFFFDPETQRRTESPDKIKITPANEILCAPENLIGILRDYEETLKGKGTAKIKASLREDIDALESGLRLPSLDRYLPLIYKDGGGIFDYAGNRQLFVCESFAVKERATGFEQFLLEEIKALLEEGALGKGLDRFALTWNELLQRYEKSGAVYLDNLPRGSFDTPVRELVTMNARQLPPWNGSLSVLLDDIRPLAERPDHACVVMAGTEKSARSLSGDLEREGIRNAFFAERPAAFPKGIVSVLTGGLSGGTDYPSSKFTLVTYGSRAAAPATQARVHKENRAAMFHSLEELVKGDYIVHTVHGIGLYEGIAKLEANGTVKDYIKIRYDKGDILYVPVTQLDQVSKYIGPRSDEKPVKLNKLGGKEWQKARSKVRAAVKDMARELISLYSKRMQIKGYAFSPDIDMQNDFELRFEYEETADQLRCIDEMKGDMERPYPMDRLLCGDVGFGKTEVALRGAFKCIADGKQCAILVPTTILALQHYQTIKKRFEGFPIETQMLSRFCTPKQISKTLTGLKRGNIDMVVGTHRLISKDVVFKDLGLIIVDEEQRFGVAQKERLKELFPTVDVLTLTATPIPRTLNMAMTGIRDMSVLEEAPSDRYPVQTYVIEHNMDVIAQAISVELRRGGQVYYLHNRVETIDKTAAKIKTALPDARVGVAHGKMNEDELSDIWRSLLEGEIDILVCTTIIETGIDVPNVNTLIIEDAERMGLAQLHQIRGRVGRSSRRASAYLTFTRGKQLTEIASRRLSAIREFTEFGSGFKIAMRDLELRGAGNILGAQQHGHLEAVGYDMYLRLLSQAVSEERGETPAVPEKECLIDLQIDAYIPEEYIESVPQKLAMYRRIADIRSDADADDVIDELQDRFGEPPDCVLGLVTVARLRSAAVANGIYEIGYREGKLMLYIEDLDMNRINRLAQRMRGRITVSAKGKPHIAVRTEKGDGQLELLTRIFSILSGGAGSE